jgi:tetratricopeptide (TPR) repeat protein
VELDPNFAMAYGRLGIAHKNLGEAGPAIEYTQKAFELRNRASEREKFYLASAYYQAATGSRRTSARLPSRWR